MFRNFKLVSNVVFGRGCFAQLQDILTEKHNNNLNSHVFLVDDVFLNSEFSQRIPVRNQDTLIWVNVDDEPKTTYVDALTQQVRDIMKTESNGLPASVIGIGGGSTMDIAKGIG